LKEVEHEIEHLKEDMEGEEWIETCQRLLLANSGWDWSTIWLLCKTVEDRVQRQLKTHGGVEDEEAGRVQGQARRTPVFPPPPPELQPPLELTLRRVGAVFDHIQQDKSASWFLEHLKQIDMGEIESQASVNFAPPK